MRETGSLVVVTGAAASGKTSLINRCVHRLMGMADVAHRRAVVVDLTDVVQRPGLTLGDRFALVTQGLIRAGLEHGFLSRDSAEEFRSRPDQHERMVDRFSVRLRQEDAMVAVLLPASDRPRWRICSGSAAPVWDSTSAFCNDCWRACGTRRNTTRIGPIPRSPPIGCWNTSCAWRCADERGDAFRPEERAGQSL
mgnify:CR=1 FL=1